MTAAAEPGANAAFCAEQVRSHDFDRYASTLFVTPAQRRALLALSAFNVEIVRVRDQVSQPLPGEIRFQWWTDTLSGTAHGGVEGHPVAAELLAAIDAYALPVAPLLTLIEQHHFDLYNDPMPDMTVLELHLAETFGALTALATRVLGAHSDAVEHAARHAGLAQGLCSALASLPFDAARRQAFVPRDVLQAHGSDLEQLFAAVSTPALRAALDQLIGAARVHLTAALNELPGLPAAARPGFLPLALVRRDLDRMARPDWTPFQPKPRSRLATLWTLWRASRTRTFR
jgi:phytoene synthase